MKKACPKTKPTRSGKCAGCGVARNREGRVLTEVVERKQDIQYFSDVEKHIGGDEDKRMSVLRVVAQLPVELNHEQECKVADRVYAQLQLECNPLVDRDTRVEDCPEEAFGRLYIILSEHIPSFKNHVCPLGRTIDKMMTWI